MSILRGLILLVSLMVLVALHGDTYARDAARDGNC